MPCAKLTKAPILAIIPLRMKRVTRTVILAIGLLGASCWLCGCATAWKDLLGRPYLPEPPGKISACADCHSNEYNTWSRTKHASPTNMKNVPVGNGEYCAVCHVVPAGHEDDPEASKPADIAQQTKTEQNELCGSCHGDRDIVGRHTVDAGGRHGLFMSVGLDATKYKEQLSCLDCHKGHGEHDDMLVTMRAHVCFTCHKEAIVTMGIAQPINYVTFGKTCFACHSAHPRDTWKQWVYTTAGTYATVVLACNACHISQDAAWQWWVE